MSALTRTLVTTASIPRTLPKALSSLLARSGVPESSTPSLQIRPPGCMQRDEDGVPQCETTEGTSLVWKKESGKPVMLRVQQVAPETASGPTWTFFTGNASGRGNDTITVALRSSADPDSPA